jgi:hypothetical protein
MSADIATWWNMSVLNRAAISEQMFRRIPFQGTKILMRYTKPKAELSACGQFCKAAGTRWRFQDWNKEVVATPSESCRNTATSAACIMGEWVYLTPLFAMWSFWFCQGLVLVSLSVCFGNGMGLNEGQSVISRIKPLAVCTEITINGLNVRAICFYTNLLWLHEMAPR